MMKGEVNKKKPKKNYFFVTLSLSLNPLLFSVLYERNTDTVNLIGTNAYQIDSLFSSPYAYLPNQTLLSSPVNP